MGHRFWIILVPTTVFVLFLYKGFST